MALKGLYGTSAVMATSVRHVVIDPQGSGVVLAATDVGLFRSVTNGLGAGWALRIAVPDDQGFFTAEDGGVLSGSGEITSTLYNAGTVTVRLKRTGSSHSSRRARRP